MPVKTVITILMLTGLMLALVMGVRLGHPSLVEVSGRLPAERVPDNHPDSTAHTTTSQTTSAAQATPMTQPDLTLNAKTGLHTHSHDDEHIPLPAALAADIERRRIPQSQLVLTPNSAGGYSMNAKGQYHTVVVAFIDDNGQLRTEERIVYPLADQPPAIPTVPPAARAESGKP
ncbi:MAG: hypothetical protein LRY66_11260 [Saccharospirillaceae bacterium]|nr:hypothetical protein [Saccharospirillaceae bacterium]MCD8531902.1 hypothetical protein [Saccharospirillaceae bacterium]